MLNDTVETVVLTAKTARYDGLVIPRERVTPAEPTVGDELTLQDDERGMLSFVVQGMRLIFKDVKTRNCSICNKEELYVKRVI